MDAAEELLSGLNPEQRFAVETLDGPLCVVAGAGSGKTRVITRRVAHLLFRGARPDSILGVTFTNRAAREMRERVLDLTGVLCRTLATFHGFCSALLREHFPALGRGGDFTIYDESDCRSLMKQVVEELDLDDDLVPPSVVLEHLSALRNARPGYEPPWPGPDFSRSIEGAEAARARYLERLVEANAVDFDELLLQAVRLLETRPEVLESVRARVSHVMVDEFQDANWAQYRLVSLLAAESRNLCVTGDPDQSIYSWRGADPRNFDDFRIDFPEAEEVVLAQNYRSTNAILRAASEVMRPAPGRIPKTLWSDLDEGEPVHVVRFMSDYEEADAVAKSVGDWDAAGFPRGKQAVMFRTNALSLPVERALIARGIPYRMLGGPAFFGRGEVKDVLAYLRVLANPRDAQALLRILNVPARGIGRKTEDALIAEARRTATPPLDLVLRRAWPAGTTKRALAALEAFADLMERLRALPTDRPARVLEATLELTGYAAWLTAKPAKGRSTDPLRNLGQLQTLARDYEEDLGGSLLQFLEQTALMGEREREDPLADPLTLLTIHASKGLEFDSVVLIGCEEELLPHSNAAREPGGVEEERRLMHVAFTRARRRLALTVCVRRSKYGREQGCTPSRFLSDLREAGLVYAGGGSAADADFDPSRKIVREPDVDDPRLRLRQGSRVRHPEYGTGVVTRLRGRSQGLDAVATVRFEDGAERSYALAYAKLEPLDVEF